MEVQGRCLFASNLHVPLAALAHYSLLLVLVQKTSGIVLYVNICKWCKEDVAEDATASRWLPGESQLKMQYSVLELDSESWTWWPASFQLRILIVWHCSHPLLCSYLKSDTPFIIFDRCFPALPGCAVIFGNYPPGRTNVVLFAGWKFVK